jgi:hypothetical protein
MNGRVRICKLDTLEAIAAALGYEVRLVKQEVQRWITAWGGRGRCRANR